MEKSKKEHVAKYAPYYESGVLDPEHHERLVMDLKSICDIAGIPDHFVFTKFSTYCGEEEKEWLRDIRHPEPNKAGLVYTGSIDSINNRMMAIAGCCLRNFIDARVMTVQDVLLHEKQKELNRPKLVLVPNFFLAKSGGGNIATWEISALLGWLYHRYAKELQTVLYVADMKLLANEYGQSFANHLKKHFYFIDGGKH